MPVPIVGVGNHKTQTAIRHASGYFAGCEPRHPIERLGWGWSERSIEEKSIFFERLVLRAGLVSPEVI